jgi:hypothetical protein
MVTPPKTVVLNHALVILTPFFKKCNCFFRNIKIFFVNTDKKREKGELTTKGTPVKTLESIFKAVKDGAEEINYLCVYNTVKTLVDEQKENK